MKASKQPHGVCADSQVKDRSGRTHVIQIYRANSYGTFQVTRRFNMNKRRMVFMSVECLRWTEARKRYTIERRLAREARAQLPGDFV
jgi:hypothetical protein